MNEAERGIQEMGEQAKSWKRTQDEEGETEGGRAVYMVVEQSGEAQLGATMPDRKPLNPGEPSSETQIIVKFCNRSPGAPPPGFSGPPIGQGAPRATPPLSQRP
jgi:hypothetical protein